MDGAGGGRGGLQLPISVLSSWLLPTPFFIFLLPPPCLPYNYATARSILILWCCCLPFLHTLQGGHPPRLVSQATNSSSKKPAKDITTSDITSQVFARPLGIGNNAGVAVVLLNRDEDPARLTVSWAELGIAPAQRMAVRDVANNKDLPDAAGSFEATVAKHDVAFITLTPLPN